MKQKINSVSSAETNDEVGANVQVTTSSPNNAKPNVGGRFCPKDTTQNFKSKNINKMNKNEVAKAIFLKHLAIAHKKENDLTDEEAEKSASDFFNDKYYLEVTETLINAMEEYADFKAKDYLNWINNQVIAGRTSAKLWIDYKDSVLS